MKIKKGLTHNFGGNSILFWTIKTLIPIWWNVIFMSWLFRDVARNLCLAIWILEWIFASSTQCGSGVCIPCRCLVDKKQIFKYSVKLEQPILIIRGSFETCNSSNYEWTWLKKPIAQFVETFEDVFFIFFYCSWILSTNFITPTAFK